MSVLLGPADADHYRVKVGRYNDRWYTDPLQPCPMADASEWTGPSVSITKPPFANKYVPMRAIADMPSDDWRRLAGKEPDARYEYIKTHDKHVSQINMSRGGIVHKWAENLLFGKPIEIGGWAKTEAETQAELFLPALQSFFDVYQPELVAAEVVCLHRTLNGVGYGGTSDAIVDIEGDVWVIDWKSRLSDHAAYPDDAGQGGAYIGAEYMIVTGPDGNPMRAPLPKVAGVLIVSIRPDGFRAYPIDGDGAISHYAEMHRWWVAQQNLTTNKVIGRPWAAKTSSAGAGDREASAKDGSRPTPPPSMLLTSAEETRRARLLVRYQAMSDPEKLDYMALGIPRDATDDDIEAGLDKVDRFNVVVPFAPEPVPASPAPVLEPPDEGGPVDQADVAALNERFKRLNTEAQLWTGTLVAQGKAGHPFHIKDHPTVRRYEIYRGILALAECFYGGGG